MIPSDSERDQLDKVLSQHYRVLSLPLSQQREAVLKGYSDAQAAGFRLPARPRRRTSLAWLATAAGLAAVAVGAALLVSSSERNVYGIEAVPRRLAEVKTIRQIGTHFLYDDRHPERPPIRVPFEYVIERPGKFRMSSYGISYGKHDPPLVRTFTSFCDGSHESWVSDQDKLVVTTEFSELDAWLKTEFRAQMFLEGLFGPSELSYRVIGHDTVRGKKCDIYEGRLPDGGKTSDGDSPEEQQVVRIWVDPALGYPLRSEAEVIGADGVRRRTAETTMIAIDEPIDAKTFQVEVPAGFTQRTVPRPTDAPPLDAHYTGASYGFDDKLELWHALQISDHAALLVWRRSTPPESADGARDWLANVTFGIPGAREHALKHSWIYESRSPDVWNWSLLHVDGVSLPERGGITLDLSARQLHSRNQILPLHFPDERLEQLIKAAAESTLPSDAPRFSLEKLRQAAKTPSPR